MKLPKTYKISETIKYLQEIKKELGDVPVYLSSDEEGNSFGTICNHSFGSDDTLEEPFLVLYPFEVVDLGRFV